MALEKNKFHRVSEEIIYPVKPSIVSVNRSEIAALIELSETNERKRIRICAHSSPADELHEMLIVHKYRTYVRPHKHLGRSESFHIIIGQADVVIFDDTGNIRNIVKMGDFQSGRTFYYRLNENLYHTLLIHSDYLVFQETTSGPFNPIFSQSASWAPDQNDIESVKSFMKKLEDDVAAFYQVKITER